MQLKQIASVLLVISIHTLALAQYGSPESLKAEMNQGNDLVFAKEAKPLSDGVNLSNAVFSPAVKADSKSPALVILHTCGGISQHIRMWADAAVKRGYTVLTVDAMRGMSSDCGSPSKLSNGRLVKDALDAVAHLANLPGVDSQRISVIGFSKGAMMASWLASTNVANTLRPATPPVAASISAYAFCALAPNRGRPQGITIVQPDTDRPLLVLMGGKDNETPPASCLELLPKLQAAGKPVQWHVYPDATHGWDSFDKDGFSKIDFKGDRVTYKYDAVATEDSVKRVFEFLANPKK
jgi:dienelactone hydrolase